MTDIDKTCPVAKCAPGTKVFAIRDKDGTLRGLHAPLPVDAPFIADAILDGPPEARMRFASRCTTIYCPHWTGRRCGMSDRLLSHLSPDARRDTDDLPPCPIRGTCRWFAQSGGAACHPCSGETASGTVIAAA